MIHWKIKYERNGLQSIEQSRTKQTNGTGKKSINIVHERISEWGDEKRVREEMGNICTYVA